MTFNLMSQPLDTWAKEMEWDTHIVGWNMLTMDPGRIALPAPNSLLITEIFSSLTNSLPWRAFLGIRRFAKVGHQFVPNRSQILRRDPPCFVFADYTSSELDRCLREDWNVTSFILVGAENPLRNQEMMDLVVRHEREELGHRPMPGNFVAATGHDNNYWMCLHQRPNEAAIRLIETVCRSYAIECRSR